MRCHLTWLIVVPVFAFATLAGCSPTGENKVKIADNALILEQDQASQATVEPDRLVFPFAGNENLLNTRTGDILVSGAGDGFYRRVKSYYRDEDRLIFLTEQASLTDVVIEGEVHKEFVLGPTDPDDTRAVSSFLLGTITQGLGSGEEIFVGIKLGGTALWFEPEKVDLKLTEGHVRFSPTIKLDLVIRNAMIVQFQAVMTGVLDFEFVVKLIVKGMFGFTTPIKLWESVPPIVLPPVMIGPVPVPTTLTIGLDFIFEAGVETDSELEGGLGGQASVSLGARFDYGLWSPVVGHDLDLWPIGPKTKMETGKSGIRLSLRPRLDLKFAGVAGPRFFVRPYATIYSERDVAPICTLVGGVTAGVLLSVAGIDPFLAKYELSTDLVDPIELGRYVGNALGICDAEAGDCVPESDADFCLNQHKDCGSVTAIDNCGPTRSVDCGKCTDPETCGGGGTDNVCGSPSCTYEGDVAFCSRWGKECGEFTGTDRCGATHSINCGKCTDPETCGGGGTDNVCGSPSCTYEGNVAFCSRWGKECGDFTGEDNCHAIKTVYCGGCTGATNCINNRCEAACGSGSVLFNGWLVRDTGTGDLSYGGDTINVYLEDVEMCITTPPRQGLFIFTENDVVVDGPVMYIVEGTAYSTPSGKFVVSLNQVQPTPCLGSEDRVQICVTRP